jgi:hypothetical protein
MHPRLLVKTAWPIFRSVGYRNDGCNSEIPNIHVALKKNMPANNAIQAASAGDESTAFVAKPARHAKNGQANTRTSAKTTA